MNLNKPALDAFRAFEPDWELPLEIGCSLLPFLCLSLVALVVVVIRAGLVFVCVCWSTYANRSTHARHVVIRL
jgi:hypothetical protein